MGRANTKAKHRRPVSETAAPSRGQRKRALKKASLVKKKGLTELSRRRTDEPEQAEGEGAEGLHPNGVSGGSTLLSRTALQGKTNPCVPKQAAFRRVISNKGKKTLMATELGQLNAVLATPSFQQDPFAAIQAHLRQTACPAPPSSEGKMQKDESTKPAKTSASRKARSAARGARPSYREARGDRKEVSRPYKGRNAKMRMK